MKQSGRQLLAGCTRWFRFRIAAIAENPSLGARLLTGATPDSPYRPQADRRRYI